jgi:hypothetical protein
VTSGDIDIRPGSTAYTYTSGMRAIEHPAISWLRGALVLAIAGQLITISALTSADPLSVTWSALWLGIAPAPVAAFPVLASAVLRRPELVRPLIVLDAVVLVVGIIGGILHTGVYFVPELIVLAIAAVKAWRESAVLVGNEADELGGGTV